MAVPASSFAAFPPSSRPVDSDINSYVLFAFDNLELQGRAELGQAATRGLIQGGNVGAEGLGGDPNAVDLAICSNGAATMDPGTQVVAPTMRLTNLCKVWDVYTNSLVGNPPVVPHNSGPTPYSGLIVPNPPTFPSFDCDPNAPAIKVGTGESPAPIAPGSYSSIRLNDNSVVTFLPGVYTMCSFSMGKNVHATATAGTTFHVTQSWSTNNGSFFGGNCDVHVYVRGDNNPPAELERGQFRPQHGYLGPVLPAEQRDESRRQHRPARPLLGVRHQQRRRRQRDPVPAADHDDRRRRRPRRPRRPRPPTTVPPTTVPSTTVPPTTVPPTTVPPTTVPPTTVPPTTVPPTTVPETTTTFRF